MEANYLANDEEETKQRVKRHRNSLNVANSDDDDAIGENSYEEFKRHDEEQKIPKFAQS